jgi:hypothetical protein
MLPDRAREVDPRVVKSITWLCVVAAAVLGAIRPESSHAADNVLICHLQSGRGTWEPLSVGPRGAEAHLAHHDDAIPGGTTSQTSTRLDADCAELQCPCDYSAENLDALGFTGVLNGCILTNDMLLPDGRRVSSAVFGTDCLFGPVGPVGCNFPSINVVSGIFETHFGLCHITPSLPEELRFELTEEEFAACRADVIEAARASGVECVERP